ncbi:MAG: hypothetical protein CFE37_04100 [Alphaproteobacteria bacterium PA4]|nr:MAG: hypothetical protein CFE37_04100 [Alphaproteobacteria bacterium PA4]
MNTPFTIEQALAIIAAHGGDAARWPDDARPGVLALAGDPAVAAALADARALDALLADWAGADAPLPALDVAAITALPQQRAPRRLPLWLGGGAIAAALAAVLVLAMPEAAPPESQIAQSTATTAPSAAVTGNDADVVFATVFTPTQDEEDLI